MSVIWIDTYHQKVFVSKNLRSAFWYLIFNRLGLCSLHYFRFVLDWRKWLVSKCYMFVTLCMISLGSNSSGCLDQVRVIVLVVNFDWIQLFRLQSTAFKRIHEPFSGHEEQT